MSEKFTKIFTKEFFVFLGRGVIAIVVLNAMLLAVLLLLKTYTDILPA